MNNGNESLVKRYLSIRSSNVTGRTKQAFKWDFLVFLKFLGCKPINDVVHTDMDAFIQHCREERKNGDEALSRKYNTLNTFFKTMIAKEYLDMKNPLDKVERIKVRKKVRSHVTLEEYKQIINYLESEKDYRGLALFSLVYSSGIRISEVYQLNKPDLDFENKEFVVKGKGDKERLCIFSEEAKIYLLQYLSTRDDDLNPLFVSSLGNRWAVSSIQQYVKKISQRAGVKKNIHPHLIRHGTAMLLLDNGLPLDEIQKVLGHENISTTQIYAKTSMKKVKTNVNNIYNKVFKGGDSNV